ncbi:glycosyltransferase family 2 protein [Qipengyuania qiaonensis]|uniref:Glycosyltransferase family 2 protein n=1 Tax=Qipengyuania qiaonensis TaxID=2867240 RepID=A0ABS7J8L7_9SPHN|nr:glycosyltransferase family 2 protein [Qipengyuania qiaonensis]MBX7483653.1 glycosyltransferase family 2 protein [Qipengyuania qiaonensis]
MKSQGLLVVIPCLNEIDNLPRILAQLRADDLAAAIVVADGGSTDGSRELVEQIAADCDRIRLLDNPARLQSAGVNLAIRTFGRDYRRFVRIDAHCVYPDDYLAGLIDAAESSGAQSVVVPMATLAHDGFQEAVATAQNSRLGTGGSAHRSGDRSGWVEHGHHALMDVGAFVDAGGYCEAMACNEDAEFDHRLALCGGRIWLERTCEIGYYPRTTPLALARQYWRYGIGRAQNVLRHRMKLRVRQMMPLSVAPSLLLLPFVAVHWIFGIPAALWFGACIIGGLALGIMRRRIWALPSGIAAAIMHASWSAGFMFAWLGRARLGDACYGFPKASSAHFS